MSGYIGVVEGRLALLRREKVIDAKGRAWVSGSLDADLYFADVRRRARAQAEQTIAGRVNGDDDDHASDERAASALRDRPAAAG